MTACIAAHFFYNSVVFAITPSNTCFLWPIRLCPQTASRTNHHTFSQSFRSSPTHRQQQPASSISVGDAGLHIQRKQPILNSRLASSFYPLEKTVYCGRKADSIEMSFGVVNRVGLRYHILDRGPDPSWKGGNLWVKWGSSVTYWENTASAIQKRLN